MKKLLAILLAALLVLALCACNQPKPLTIDTTQYADPPQDEWVYVLDIYWAWNGVGGDSWDYTLSVDGIVEEGWVADPDIPDDEYPTILAPGGRSFYFHGVAPGDVLITFTNTNGKKVVDQAVYAVRVFDNLRLALLDEKHESYRG